MDTLNPYQPSPSVLENSTPPRKRFRWRVLPVTLLTAMTFLVFLVTMIDWFVLGYGVYSGYTSEDWLNADRDRFLRDGLIGILQVPLLGLGTYWLWKTKYRRAFLLLIPAFLVRSIVVWWFPN